MLSECIQNNYLCKCLIWNCQGLNNLFNLDIQQQQTLESFEIIGVCETWHWSDRLRIPSFLEIHYRTFHSLAVKEKALGRASGGLIMFIRKQYEAIELDKSNMWLALKICGKDIEFIIIMVYFKPTCDIVHAIEMLEELISNLYDKYPNMKLIITGDFNARIGLLNQGDSEIFNCCRLDKNRKSLDIITNKRGEILNEFMENQGLTVINGRSLKDNPAQFTYISKNGMSVVDLCWVSYHFLNHILDFHVENFIVTADHVPISVTLDLGSPVNSKLNVEKKYKKIVSLNWASDKELAYREEMKKIKMDIDFDNTSCDEIYKFWVDEIFDKAKKIGMYTEKSICVNGNRKSIRNNQIWYSNECKEKKINMNNMFKICKNNNFEESFLDNYLIAKKNYKSSVKKAKKDYHILITDKLSDTKNSQEFWKVFREIKKGKILTGNIKLETWEKYLKSLYPPKINIDKTFIDVRHPFLDSPFERSEIKSVVGKLKNGKAPGLDKIKNEFLKNLPDNCYEAITKFFNKIWETEKIPLLWSNIEMVMLPKKGNPEEPNNYRGIALLNTFSKLFTGIIANRLHRWVEDNVILLENQSGFRKGRSCIDNIFTINSLIQINLRLRKSKVYATFVDFRKAFDSVEHDILFAKLFKYGISGKIIRVLKCIYDNAKISSRIFNQNTSFFNVSKGVLQGEPISPLLFSLFLNDLEELMIKNNVEGLSIDSYNEIKLLLYADDLVMLSTSFQGMQKQLNVLAEFCKTNSMTINVGKTKQLVFRKGGRVKETEKLKLNDEYIERVSSYNYLGVIFSDSGLYSKEAKFATQKSSIAINNVRSSLVTTKATSWDARIKLYHAIILSTLLYGSEIWGIRYLQNVEKVQTNFFKTIFCWPKSTPGYIIRLETGMTKLSIIVLKMALLWWVKLLNMCNDRYPKLCFKRLCNLDSRFEVNAEKYNWATQLKNILISIGLEQIWINQNSNEIKSELNNILNKYKKKLELEDKERALNSTYSEVYQYLKCNEGTESYLKSAANIDKIRLISQIRVMGKHYIRLVTKGYKYMWKSEELCSICNLNKAENMYHFLVECPIYKNFRDAFIYKYCINCNENNYMQCLLTNLDAIKINHLYLYIINSLRIRSFIIYE